MTWSDVLFAQLTDVLRLGLMAALCWTTLRLREQSGTVIPLVIGIVFFAVFLPNTMPIAGATTSQQMAVGVLANAIIVAVITAAWVLSQRFRR